MSKIFLSLSFLIILVSCQKNNDPSPQPEPTPVPQLKLDSSHLTVSGSKNTLDSFTIQYSGRWTIATNPSTASWLKTNVSSGTGSSKIYVFAQEDNNSGAERTATLVVTPDSDDTKSTNLPVTQKIVTPPSTIIWSKVYGGSGQDNLHTILKTADGGYIALGSSGAADGDVHKNNGHSDLWIVKTDENGKILWEKSYGGSLDDYGSAMVQSGDGGYFVSCTSFSGDGDVGSNKGAQDIWILKIDATGNLLWKKGFGGNATDACELHSISASADGGCVIAAGINSKNGDFTGGPAGNGTWIIKLDNQGNKQWSQAYGGSMLDLPTTIITVADGYVVGGVSLSNDGSMPGGHGKADAYVLKLDLSGNKVWLKKLGGSQDEWTADIKATPDGGLIVAGGASSNDGDVTGLHSGNSDAWIIKLDGSGNKIWQKTLGGTAYDEAESIILTSDNGYLFSGSTQSTDGDVASNHGSLDAWVVKLDADGNKVWQKTFGGTGGEANIQSSILATNDGNFLLITGTTSTDGDITGNHGSPDGWIIKFKVP